MFGGERSAVMGARTSPFEVSTLGILGWDGVTPVCKILNPSRIPHEGLAGAKGSSPKKVKAKRFGLETSTSNEIVQRSTSVPWMWHQVVLEWVRI